MNFNTSNQTYRHIMGNGLSYHVPTFQRDYSWDTDEWDDLWQDIAGLYGETAEPAHYMGYLVLQSADNKEFDIIDGQQRMTTLSLLILAAVSHLSNLASSEASNDPQIRRAEQLRNSYIGYLDPVSLVPRSKLTLNRHNDVFYQNYLVPLDRLPQRGLNASEHLLRKAFIWLKDHIKTHCGENGEAVAKFIDHTVDKLFFTVITVTDELNAFKVFETLNARGVRLSATDLLKNYLFSVVSREAVHDSEIKALEDRWESIVELLGSESFPEFLRVFWNSRNKLVRKTELFKTIRGEIRTREDAFKLIRDLDRYARIYSAIRYPDDTAWTPEELDSLDKLQMFGVRQPHAVLLAVFDKFSETERGGIQRFLNAIVMVSFRYNVICGRQANEQEMAYNRIAQAVYQDRISDISSAISALSPIYPGDSQFKSAFAEKVLRTTSARNKKITRYILFQLERQHSHTEYEFESAKYDVEHVLPINPGDDWDQFDEQQRESATYRLGNMTPLETSSNRDVGNIGFEKKRPVYESSDFSITAKLALDFDSWTVEKIRSRQQWMAKQATGIWKIGFQ